EGDSGQSSRAAVPALQRSEVETGLPFREAEPPDPAEDGDDGSRADGDGAKPTGRTAVRPSPFALRPPGLHERGAEERRTERDGERARQSGECAEEDRPPGACGPRLAEREQCEEEGHRFGIDGREEERRREE